MKKETVLVLKSVNADLTSYNGFKWKENGIVKCKDFKDTEKCGNGLHGFLWGEGNGSLANWNKDAKWLVLKVDKDSIIDLDGKVKFPSCNVVFCGNRKDATDYIILNGAKGSVIASFVISGYYGTSISGYYGTSISGDYGTSTSGYSGTSTSGDCGTLVIKYCDNYRYKVAVAYIGENGIEPNVAYKLDKNHNFVKA